MFILRLSSHNYLSCPSHHAEVQCHGAMRGLSGLRKTGSTLHALPKAIYVNEEHGMKSARRSYVI